ncbi:lectin-like domain-containing protein [Microtetraspora malaysiensis]|uniref:lectin-like domain-containing protein n=1 Tax=Microtetraspora malaysiensis TaxID=161358 RepID=UPI003D945AF0
MPPGNAAPFGFLQLTDAHLDQRGGVIFDAPIPSRDGLDLTFEQWQYGSDTLVPADGINFFLAEAGRQIAPGGFGGSLGYAQLLPDDDPANPFLPGVPGGYIGVGLDVLGNYFGDWEHRGNGCPPGERSPAGTIFRVPAPGLNMVTVRGPGEGVEGYCFLTATTSNFSDVGPWPSTLPGSLQGPTTAVSNNPQQAVEDLEPSRRTVHIRITPSPDPVVTVAIDFNDGNGFQPVLAFDAPEPVPANYSFGFTASTGLFNDVHLIRNLRIATVVPPEPEPEPEPEPTRPPRPPLTPEEKAAAAAEAAAAAANRPRHRPVQTRAKQSQHQSHRASGRQNQHNRNSSRSRSRG